MTRSQIFKVVKWCVKWSATAGGLFIANYIFNGFQLVGVVTILGILFIFSVMLAPRSEQIKAIKFFPIFFMPIFILCISIFFVVITMQYYLLKFQYIDCTINQFLLMIFHEIRLVASTPKLESPVFIMKTLSTIYQQSNKILNLSFEEDLYFIPQEK